MKSVGFVMMALSLVISMPAVAKDKGQKHWGDPAVAKKADPPALQDVTIVGRISNSQTQDKKGNVVTSYVLTDPTGQAIKLPTPHSAKAKKGEVPAPAINLDDYVGKMVTIVAKGTESVSKKGAKITHIQKIVSVTAADAVPDAVPAAAPAQAPAAAPAPDVAPAPAPAAPAPDANPK